MIIDAPHSVGRAYLGMKELETFIPRYVDVVLRVVAEMHNAAEKLKVDDKETRDGALGALLAEVNTIILGTDAEKVKVWPLVVMSPTHVGLAFRSQLIYLLTREEVSIDNILNFINVVYFPTLNLTGINQHLLKNGKYAVPNSAAFQHMLVLLIHQVAQMSSRGELTLPEEPAETDDGAGDAPDEDDDFIDEAEGEDA